MKISQDMDKSSRKFFLAGLLIGLLAFPVTVASLLGADNITDFLRSFM